MLSICRPAIAVARSQAWALDLTRGTLRRDRLAILDAAHPRALQKRLRNPRQLLRVWYFFFALPGLPERVVRAGRWRFFRRFLRDARPAYSPEEIDRYVEA